MKKFLLITVLLLLLFCFSSDVYASNLIPYNQMNEEIARDILDWCVENTSSQVVIDYYTNYDAALFAQYFNSRVETFKNNLNIDLQYLDQFILYFDNALYFFISNNTLSDTLPYTSFYTRDAYDNKRLIYGNYLKLSIQGSTIYDTEKSNSYVTNYSYSDDVTFNSDYTIIDAPALVGMTSISTIEGNVFPDMSTKYFFLKNYIYTYESDNPINPSGDTSGDSGGDSGGNVDLSGIQTGISNINNNLNNIENKIPSSGDIANSTQIGIVSGNQEFWGSSVDLSGDQQEELIVGKIDELTNTLSGDLAENEIFGILQNYEDKLFGGFTGEEDFIISWNDINYNGQILIPAGEVNFSEICRENEVLGNVKSTINIILTFIILMNIVIYMYNLLLATLGIDNPYLYENPVGSVTTSEYTDEGGRTYVTRTQHDGRGNSISKRYNHTLEPKKRQIGFRKW